MYLRILSGHYYMSRTKLNNSGGIKGMCIFQPNNKQSFEILFSNCSNFTFLNVIKTVKWLTFNQF